MDVLHSDLKAIEEFRFRILHFCYKVLSQVFVHDTIAGSEEGQHVFNEMALIIVQLILPMI